MPPHPTQTAALDEEQKWANSFEVTLAVHARTIKMMPANDRERSNHSAVPDRRAWRDACLKNKPATRSFVARVP
jgi:hypothetical protein